MPIDKDIIEKIPKRPGVYFFKNLSGEILYIGKAKNLKNRIKQYLSGTDDRPQIPFLMKETEKLEYTIVNTEIESLYLERTLIQKYTPKYNIDLRDDKNYAFIKIDYATEIPQISIIRKLDSPQNNSQHFGPFTATGKIKETLNLSRKIFSYCSANKVSSKPCFYYHLHRCPGVCIGKISLIAYKQHLEKIVKFFKGDTEAVSKEILKEMHVAVRQKKFETAARFRDQLSALKMLEEKQNVILPKKVDWDIISFATENKNICINLFKIRNGKMLDKENFIYSNTIEDSNNQPAEVLQTFLERYYLETSSFPKIIYSELPANNPRLIENIFKKRCKKSVKLKCPKKGQISALIKLGKINAQEYLTNWQTDKAYNINRVQNALSNLQKELHLPKTPERIEAYDISNTQGTNAVGSMVVFKNGLPAKSEYKKFKIKTKNTPDDFTMMKEVLERRFSRSSVTQTSSSNPWPLPNLIVIDGGKGQLSAAVFILKKFKLSIPIIGLAKRMEEIFLPGKSEPLILAHNNPELQLLQRLRDEAHRFGITFHRSLRGKEATKSALDSIPGIGPKTKKLLKNNFGTVKNIKKTNIEELAKIVGKKLANTIKQAL